MEEFIKAYNELKEKHGFEIIPQITLGVRKVVVEEADARNLVSKEEAPTTE